MHRQPKGGSSHNRTLPQPRTCTHCKSLQTCPCHQNTAPLCPHCLPCRHPSGQSGHGRQISRAVGRHHDVQERRSFEPPSRWSSQIGASVTTASGIDLWARESGSARSRAYSRLRRGKRGSIALSPYGFAPGQYAPSRSRVHLIGTRTLGLSQCTREHPGSGQGWHASSTLVQAGRMLPQPTAAAVCRAAPAGAPTHEGQRPVSSQLPDSSRGRCAPPRSRSSFASAQLGAASPTATGRTLLSQHRAAVARPS